MKKIYYILIVIISFSVGGCSAMKKENEFFYRNSSGSGHSFRDDLIVGSKVEFFSKNLGENETILLYRCGEKCKTAKEVIAITPNDILSVTKKEAVISESGQYYFWIKKCLPSGEAGPVFISDEYVENLNTGVVKYESGTIIKVHVE